MLVLSGVIAKDRHGGPQPYRNSVECVVTSCLRIPSLSLDYLGIDPSAPVDCQTVVRILVLLNSPLQHDLDRKIKPLDFKRVFREILFTVFTSLSFR